MIGRTIGNYRLEALLGQGGMGAVYRGTDVLLDRPVAIKSLRADVASNPQLVERFKQEARTLARLLHPNIATLYTLVREGKDMYMVMEFCEGETLESILKRRGRLAPEEALALIDQAMYGLEHAHNHGIVHRDIKPANLMRLPDGTIKVMDFGIARLRGSSRLTQTSHTVGTAEYMAPEQIRSHEVDARADIYALGVLLFELLTGRVPFTSESFFEVMQAHLEETPPPPGQFVSGLDDHVENAILKALEKDKAKRFASVEEFREALQISSGLPAFRRPKRSRSFGLKAPALQIPAGLKTGVDTVGVAAGKSAEWMKANPVMAGVAGFGVIVLGIVISLFGMSSPDVVPASTNSILWEDDSTESVSEEGGWSSHSSGSASWSSFATAADAARRAQEPTDFTLTLASARSLYQQDQLVAPPNANALALAERVLAAQPTNTDAQNLIRDIALRLVSLGEQSLQQNRISDARRFFEQAVAVADRHPQITGNARSRASSHLTSARLNPSSQTTERQPSASNNQRRDATPTASTRGSIRVIVRPFGDVYVNGRRHGARNTNAPVVIDDLPPGTHQIRVQHPDLGTQERTVTVRADRQEDVRIEFVTSRDVTVTSNPPNGEIFLDGRSTGRYTPANISIPPGQHTIEVRRDGYRPVSRIVVNDGRDLGRISLTLIPNN